MITLSKLSYDEFEALAAEYGLLLPIEQTAAWASFEKLVDGRTPWGACRIDDDGELLGLVSFIDYATHGYHYLRAHHAPVWVRPLDAEEERQAIAGLARSVASLDGRVAFIRLAVKHESDVVAPTLSTLPYDTTVVLDVTGTEEDILSRMKPRGRRDVRKALRECPATCSDETEIAVSDFSAYYEIMCETGSRDGFIPAPMSDYANMIRALGPEHCRVFAARIDGELVAWSMVTMNDGLATRYYAATTRDAGRKRVADKLVLFEAVEVSKFGCASYDLMGIGSDFAPETKNLNEFKTKFTKEVTPIAPDRDVPIRGVFYRALCAVKDVRARKRARVEAAAESKGVAPRTDFQPVILGGDVSAYALSREFFEGYGVSSICVAPAPIALIEKSAFTHSRLVPDMSPETIASALGEISAEHAQQKIVLMANTDALVEALEQALGRLPKNVLTALPPHDVMRRVSDKVQFEKLCDEYGLDTTHSEVVSLAGDKPIAPTSVPFPLIAKPAVSAGYAHLYGQGFKKVYFVREQSELDDLWRDLRSVGFSGDFLVQELIEGDDTYVDMITVYVNAAGKATLFSSSQVLLEDHSPSLFGNPVAMLTRPKPELWDKVERMLSEIGWRGFANFDLKRDKNTGREIFMDFNPRIGRNSYYCCAGGVNPMIALVEDVVDGKSGTVRKIDKKALYTLAPASMVRRYLLDPVLRDEFDEVVDSGEVHNPTRCNREPLAARALGALMECNYRRKFARDYPEATDSAF